jgi:hypothetical protein
MRFTMGIESSFGRLFVRLIPRYTLHRALVSAYSPR